MAVEAKIVVWEHNSHVGEARATSMGDSGEWNVGQLSRAVEPLDRTAGWESAEAPETFPSGV